MMFQTDTYQSIARIFHRFKLDTIKPSAIKLACFIVSYLTINLTLSGCATLLNNLPNKLSNTTSTYAHEVQATSTNAFVILVKARLEQEGLKKSIHLAHAACKKNNRPRVLLLNQTSSYIATHQSEYPTAYYKVTSNIKCK